MTDFGRRGGIPPPVNPYRLQLSHLTELWAVVRQRATGLWAVGRQRAEDAELLTSQLTGAARQLVETLRQYVFFGRARPAHDYDEPGSEMSAFLRSCRRIFWALAAFSGMS